MRPALLAAGAGTGLAMLLALARRHRSRRLAHEIQGRFPVVRTEDGVRLHVEVDDPVGAGVTVVLVHGLAADLREFRAQRAALRCRARLVLFDQRGHGRSGWNGPSGVGIDRLAADLESVLERTADGGRLVLVGHSLGAMAVLALARRRPTLFGDAVAGVGLLSGSAGPLDDAVLPAPARRVPDAVLRGAARVPWVLAPLVQRVAPFRRRRVRRRLSRRLFGRTAVSDDVERQMHESWASTPRAVTATLYPALLDHDTTDALPVLRGVPMLVLAGTDDATIPVEHSRRIARAVGTARLEEVEGAGHMVNLTHPEVVNRAIGELLDEVAGAA